MVALGPGVVDALWAALEPELPVRGEPRHPLGCRRRRILGRDVFEGVLFWLVTGCSWDVAGRLGEGGETTLRARCNAWSADGVFDWVVSEALEGYGRFVGFDLAQAAVGGSVHKAPGGGGGTGKSPVDRGESGWKWPLLTDRWGIPVGWAADGADRRDQTLLEPTLGAAACSVMSRPCTLIAAMPGTRSPQPVTASASMGRPTKPESTDGGGGFGGVNAGSVMSRPCTLIAAMPGTRSPQPVTASASTTGCAPPNAPAAQPRGQPETMPLGQRWTIEPTNSWLSNFGQPRRSTDRNTKARLGQLASAIALIITVKLFKWADRCNHA